MAQVKKALSVISVAIVLTLTLSTFVLALLYQRESNINRDLRMRIDDARIMPELLEKELIQSREERRMIQQRTDSLLNVANAAQTAQKRSAQQQATLKKQLDENLNRWRVLPRDGRADFFTEELAKVDTIR